MPRPVGTDPAEPGPTRLKRLRLRSWRRGTREMDLLLGPYADTRIEELDAAALDAYEALLEVNDPELYRWLSGRDAAPGSHAATVARIAAFHGIDRGHRSGRLKP